MHARIAADFQQALRVFAAGAPATTPELGMDVDVVTVQRGHDRHLQMVEHRPQRHQVGAEMHMGDIGLQTLQIAPHARRRQIEVAQHRAKHVRDRPHLVAGQQLTVQFRQLQAAGILQADQHRAPALQRQHLVADEGLGQRQEVGAENQRQRSGVGINFVVVLYRSGGHDNLHTGGWQAVASSPPSQANCKSTAS